MTAKIAHIISNAEVLLIFVMFEVIQELGY